MPVAHAAQAFVPNDPGGGSQAGGWEQLQWNFAGPFGVDAPDAWGNAISTRRPGGAGVTVAVLDTGVAYTNWKGYRRSPDFAAGQFVSGYDFVDHDSRPLDTNGHGTDVASTIAERTNNGYGLTGLAYGARIMPVRVLDAAGDGHAAAIAAGIRFAARHGAQVINMSFNFGCGKKVPDVDEALRLAAKKGIVLVASVGNIGSETCISPPATEGHVIGVGGATQGGCLGSYSLAGEGVDVLAPGGGEPIAGCPSILSSPIYQVTLKSHGSPIFGTPGDYIGTSMAAAHVSGVAAMTIASGVLGKVPPRSLSSLVTQRLKDTARSLGLPETLQGHGLIDAARATDPECQLACFSHQS
jgi:serine protease